MGFDTTFPPLSLSVSCTALTDVQKTFVLNIETIIGVIRPPPALS